MRTRARRLAATTVMVAVFATACGGGLSELQTELVATANANTPAIQLTSDLATTQMLDSRTGQITDLSEVVTGDRAVLMWYWAPT